MLHRLALALLVFLPSHSEGHPLPIPEYDGSWDPVAQGTSGNADQVSCYNPVGGPSSDVSRGITRTEPAMFRPSTASGKQCVFPFRFTTSNGVTTTHDSCACKDPSCPTISCQHTTHCAHDHALHARPRTERTTTHCKRSTHHWQNLSGGHVRCVWSGSSSAGRATPPLPPTRAPTLP